MNKLYIFTEGGSKFGLGHLARCCALYDEFEEHGLEVCFIVNGDQAAKDFLSDYKAIFDSWYGRLEHYTQLKGFYCIVDSYHATLSDYQYIATRSKKALYIDDNNRLNYPPGLVLNFAIYANQLNYPSHPDIKYLLGIEYAVLRKAFRQEFTREINAVISNILIMMGGADICNLTPAAIHAVSQAIPNAKLHIIIGNAFHNHEQIFTTINNLDIADRCQYYQNIDQFDLFNLMKTCDLAISAAGQTTFELIACKLPFVAVQVADNQKGNISGLQEKNLILGYANCKASDSFSQKSANIYTLIRKLSFVDRKNSAKLMKKYNLAYSISNVAKELLLIK